MATPTYDLIDSQVLSTSAASVSFTSIPATYRDLVLVVDVTSDNVRDWTVKFNNVGSGYSTLLMGGNGSIAFSSTSPYDTAFRWPETIVGRASFILQAMDYSATDKHKSVLIRANSNERLYANAGRWANTAAVNRIDIAPVSGANFLSGSTFYLYGIAG